MLPRNLRAELQAVKDWVYKYMEMIEYRGPLRCMCRRGPFLVASVQPEFFNVSMLFASLMATGMIVLLLLQSCQRLLHPITELGGAAAIILSENPGKVVRILEADLQADFVQANLRIRQ